MPTAIDSLVGASLRMRRNELGLSQSDLAKALGITFQQVQKYEKGSNRVPVGRLAAAAAFLKVPISYFFGGDSRSSQADAEELGLLRPTGAWELLRLYQQIEHPDDRKALLKLALSLQSRTARRKAP